MHTIFKSFTNHQINEACKKILEKNFDDLQKEDREILIKEYAELNDLPTISLIRDENMWNHYDFCKTCHKFYDVRNNGHTQHKRYDLHLEFKKIQNEKEEDNIIIKI